MKNPLPKLSLGLPRPKCEVRHRTPACGTGACAAVVAAHRQKRAGRDVKVEVDGGVLHIHWRESDGHVIMSGPVELEGQGTL